MKHDDKIDDFIAVVSVTTVVAIIAFILSSAPQSQNMNYQYLETEETTSIHKGLHDRI